VPGQRLVRHLKPTEQDYFVLKPKNSGFYETTLQLEYLGARTVILTGIAADNCVLFTANDAYMRDYSIIVPADCVASRTESLAKSSLTHMKRLLKADLTPSTELDLAELARSSDRE
jgi:nicotinamidase-related amidase